MDVSFIRDILPQSYSVNENDDLYFFIAIQTKERKFKQYAIRYRDFLQNPDIVLEYYRDDVNVYFTPVLFSSPQRLKRYAAFAQALIVDYDDKPSLDVLIKKVVDIGIPQPSYVVDTGRGYHLWWLLDDVIDAVTYEKTNRILTRLLEADTNAVRLTQPFRVPETYNVKYAEPVKAVVKVALGERYSIKDFQFELPQNYSEYENAGVDASEIASILAPYYTKGQRHQLILGLAGLMKKTGIEKREAMEIVKAICEELDDAEVNDRLRAVEDTYKKDVVAGASVLAEISVELVNRLRKVLKPPAFDIQHIVENLYVVGKEFEGDKVYALIYNKQTGKTLRFNILDQRLLKLRVVLGLREKDADVLRKVREWIEDETTEAEEINDENVLGKGYWKIDENTVLYNGKVSLLLENKMWQVYLPPYYKNYILSRSDQLVEGANEKLIYILHNTHLREYPLAETEMAKFLRQFNWRYGEEDVLLFSSFVYTALIGKEVNDRFLVYVYGNKGYGKSTIFRYLKEITQGLTVSIKNASEFAKYKILSINQVIPLYDDFEPNYKRNFQVIDMWKDNTQGMAVMLRGTKTQNINEYRIFHIPFFNSINFTISDEAVASRILSFRLEKPNSNSYLKEPNSQQAFIENTNNIAIVLLELPQIKQQAKKVISDIIPPHERLNNMLLIPIGIMLRLGVEEDVVKNIVKRLWKQHKALIEEYSVETLFWEKFFKAKPRYNLPYVEDLLEGAILHDNEDYVNILAENGILVSEDKEVFLIQKSRRLVKDEIILTKEAFKRILERFPTTREKIVLANRVRKSVRQAWDITKLVYNYLKDNGIEVEKID